MIPLPALPVSVQLIPLMDDGLKSASVLAASSNRRKASARISRFSRFSLAGAASSAASSSSA